MDVRIDQAPGQSPRRRQTAAPTAAALPQSQPRAGSPFDPPPVLIRIPDLEVAIAPAPTVSKPVPTVSKPMATDERVADVRTRIDTPVSFPTHSALAEERTPAEEPTPSISTKTSATITAAERAVLNSEIDLDEDQPPAPYMPKLPPVLQRAGSYRASPTVLLGVIVVVLCLAALPLLRRGSDSTQPTGDASRLTAQTEPAPWPGAPSATLAEAETADSGSMTKAEAESAGQALASAEPKSETLEEFAPATVAEVSRWPRETDSTPVAQFEGSIVKPTLRAQHERVGSSIH